MTEAEWLNCTDLGELLRQVKGEHSKRAVPGWASERKLRLLACACCRRIWRLITDPRSRDAVEIGERYADGRATKQELDRACHAAGRAHSDACAEWDGDWSTLNDPAIAATRAAFYAAAEADNQYDEDTPYLPDADDVTHHCVEAVRLAEGPAAGEAEAAAQRALFHDIFRNPFGPVLLNRSRIPLAVTLLARTAYLERAFGRLPELADAMEKAGWADAEVLAHCRQPGPHVRGCWVIDLVLGREPTGAPASPVLEYGRAGGFDWQPVLSVGRRALAAWRTGLAAVSMLVSMVGVASLILALVDERSFYTGLLVCWWAAMGMLAVALAIPAFMRGRGVFPWVAMLLACATMTAPLCLWAVLAIARPAR